MKTSLPRLLREPHRLRHGGDWRAVQRPRVAELVAHARAHSPYYRELYAGLPSTVDTTETLPVTDKKALMARYDDWATDRAVTLTAARAFVADPALSGEKFLGEYLAVTTSGTTGTPAVFVKDAHDIAVNSALSAAMMTSWLGAGGIARIVAAGGRMAVVAATNGHFLVSAGIARMRGNPLARKAIRPFSVHTPLAELTDGLNDFRPAVLIGYGSVLGMLAGEREAGRLRISPVLVEPAGETLGRGEYERMARVFGAKVRDTYGSSECPFLTEGCAEGWYHVNAGWAVLEPVEADHSPTPAGRPSHTVLVSNLANRVQPILRYDLGDSVLQRPDRCPCGNPLPAYRVRGRVANMLRFGDVALPPLALGTVIDGVAGVELYQLVQTGPAELRLRLRTTPAASADAVWKAVDDGITALLAGHGLGHVRLERAEEPPRQAPGGKYRTIIPLEENA